MNNLHKILLIPVGLLVALGSGCTSQTSNESASGGNTSNTNGVTTVNTNTSEMVVEDIDTESVNENTNVVDTAINNTDTNDSGNTDEVTVNEEDDIDTSDWLTYTNEEYGFSVDYPRDWNYEINTEGLLNEDVISILFLSPEDQEIKSKDDFTDLPLGYEVIVRSTNLSPAEFAEKRMQGFNLDYSEIINDAHLEGVKYWEPGLSEGAYVNVLQLNSSMLIQLISFSKEASNSQMFDKFINSVHLINES